jgi:Ca2+-binding EF-hand superfamily protein
MLRCNNDENLSKITDHIFSCFDRDANGYLDFSEFLIAYSATSIGDSRTKLGFVFQFYDKDHDGTIRENEFLKVIESMYEFRGKNKKDYPPEKCVKDIFERIDENGDKKLTKEEFIEGCLKHKHIIDLISPFDIY